jgi:oxygen-independent coproporphyrinogen-3 oxidase
VEFGIYVHTPFCPSKCGYCDFNSYAMSGEIMERFTEAVIREIRSSPFAGRRADTIFFGGGTPTFLPHGHLEAILLAITDTFPLTRNAVIPKRSEESLSSALGCGERDSSVASLLRNDTKENPHPFDKLRAGSNPPPYSFLARGRGPDDAENRSDATGLLTESQVSAESPDRNPENPHPNPPPYSFLTRGRGLGIEVTSEANPGTADAGKFAAMRRAGFNRISIGAQSFDDDELHRLERVHKADEIGRAGLLAREAGFENLNLDLMFALPLQTMERWRENLERAIALAPEHLSLYCLTIEPGTKFHTLRQKGELPLPDDDATMEMLLLAKEVAEAAGYRQYEISNFAKPGYECRHNLIYWRNEEYLGFGPGAVSFVSGERRMNTRHPRKYIQSGGVCESERVSAEVSFGETMMLGLRLNDGIELARLEARHPEMFAQFRAVAAELVEMGWLNLDCSRIWLTDEGRLFHNEVAMRFLP